MLHRLTEDCRRAVERYDCVDVGSALEIDRSRQGHRSGRHPRTVTEKELKVALEETLRTQQRVKS